MARYGNEWGFTLLELMLVLLLMGLAYGIAAPSLGAGSSGTELKAAARQIGAGLRKARDVAVVSQSDSLFELNLESRSFKITGDEKAYNLPRNLELKLFTATTEVNDSNIGAIRFFADGSSTGGSISVGPVDMQYVIDVDWLTGRIKIN